MKKLTLLFILLISVISLCFTFDDLNRFGTKQEEFKERLTTLATYKEFPGFRFYYSQAIKKACMAIPATEQANAAKAIGKMVKSFVMSNHFKTDYEKNLVPTLKNTDKNSAEMKEKYEAYYNNFVESTEAMLKVPNITDQLFAMQEGATETGKNALEEIKATDISKVSAEEAKLFKNMQAIYQRMIDNAQAVLTLKPLAKSNPKEFTKQYAKIMAEQAMQADIDNAKEENERLLTEAAEKKDYKANIKTQLQQFLDESADVDFSAKVMKESSGFENFENETYREKSRIWKQCFRIGKPATTAFREIAQTWITEL